VVETKASQQRYIGPFARVTWIERETLEFQIARLQQESDLLRKTNLALENSNKELEKNAKLLASHTEDEKKARYKWVVAHISLTAAEKTSKTCRLS
jgi:cell division protein FtsB